MHRFYMDADEVIDLSKKLNRSQMGIWIQLVAAIASLSDDGMVSVSDLRNHSFFSSRDIPLIIDLFCRETTVLEPVSADRKVLVGDFANERVKFLRLCKSVKTVRKKIKLSDGQKIIKENLLNTFPKVTKNLDEAIARWTEAYPGLDLVASAKEADLWAFQKNKRHKNTIAFLGNWFKNNQKFARRDLDGNSGFSGANRI